MPLARFEPCNSVYPTSTPAIFLSRFGRGFGRNQRLRKARQFHVPLRGDGLGAGGRVDLRTGQEPAPIRRSTPQERDGGVAQRLSPSREGRPNNRLKPAERLVGNSRTKPEGDHRRVDLGGREEKGPPG